MPLYEYRCSQCEGITEVQARFTDAPPMGCSQCGQMGAPLHKIFSRVAVGNQSGAAQETAAEASTTQPSPKHSCSGSCGH